MDNVHFARKKYKFFIKRQHACINNARVLIYALQRHRERRFIKDYNISSRIWCLFIIITGIILISWNVHAYYIHIGTFHSQAKPSLFKERPRALFTLSNIHIAHKVWSHGIYTFLWWLAYIARVVNCFSLTFHFFLQKFMQKK